MQKAIKKWLKQLPIGLTRNHHYDLMTRRIIRKHCKAFSNCIDIGAHEGEILDLFLRYAPNGCHYAFEPLPHLYERLDDKYERRRCHIYPVALSDKKAKAPFNYVITNPAYSGLKKRRYDRPDEKDREIIVDTNTLDAMVPPPLTIHLIKIDVEGGELDVLRGAHRILSEYKPLLIFEFGLGGSDIYGATPDGLYQLLSRYGYSIYLLDQYLDGRPPLTPDGLSHQFYNRKHYYFVAA